MALAVTKISDLNPSDVTRIHAELTQFLRERYPEVDLARGVIHDLVVYFGAILEARIQTELQRYMAARSLAAIESNPAHSFPELVDDILSNYLISRRSGALAAGSITIVFSNTSSTVIAPSVTFSGNGVGFQVIAPYTAIPPGAQPLSPTEIVMQSRGDGTYKVTIPARAVSAGTSGNVSRGTRLVPDAPTSNFVLAYAETDFSGGADTETNAELVHRLQEGIAAKTWSNRTNIIALIKSRPDYAGTIAYSIVGHGQAEMRRDQHGILPISAGGKVDVYARTSLLPVDVVVAATATLIAKTADGGIWQFSIDADTHPGFYEVTGIFPSTGSSSGTGFEVVEDIRGYDLSAASYVPDIAAAAESAYSRYQTAVIRFLDTETPVDQTALGTTSTYQVVLTGMPLIASLQNFLGSPSVINPGGDVLVRAAIPCWLSINLEIQQAVGEPEPDTDAIKNALAEAVNTRGFPGQLHASTLADVVHGYLTQRQAVKQFDMRGRIRCPSGNLRYIHSTTRLVIPDVPEEMVSGRTTTFILDPRNIGITVATEGFTDS